MKRNQETKSKEYENRERNTLSELEQRRDLRKLLTNSDFSIKGECVISLMMTKLHIIDTMLFLELDRNAIQMKAGRLKTLDSVCKKLQKKNLELNFENAVERVNDLIGMRAVCAYTDDIYRVAELIEAQKDIRVVKKKDYIKEPKKSGYQSLHMILEVAIPFQGHTQWMKCELQLRTASMDYWAKLDHQLRYKRGRKGAVEIDEELRECAEVIGQLDQRMLEIRKKIDQI